jgi:transcriptional repressor NrdR
MKCLFCGSEQSKVIDKRAVRSLGEVRRRRECLKCHKRYTTYERICDLELYILKRDGRREMFDRVKLHSGLEKALQKRVEAQKIEEIANRIEAKLRGKGEREVKSTVIGGLVLTELKKTDKIAYLRFASVYRDFKELGDFTKELQVLS